MKIQAIHPLFRMPAIGTIHSAGYDLAMPEAGILKAHETRKVGLGFAAEVPEGYAALLLPRSSAGAKGLELMNTVGLIDSDYRGEWIATMHMKKDAEFRWISGDRLFQFILVPIHKPLLELVDSVSDSDRGTGGFGSTGQ